MKVVFVTKGFHSAIRGAESAARDWFVEIRKHVDATLVTDSVSIIDSAIKKSPISFATGANPVTFLVYASSISRKLKHICNEVKPDLVHIHGYSGYIAIPPVGIPTIVTLHDEPFVKINNEILPAPFRLIDNILRLSQDSMRRLLLSRNPYLHAIGTTSATFIQEKYPNIEARIIPNPVITSTPHCSNLNRNEVLHRLGLPDNAKIVLTVGNLESRKAVHKILAASQLLNSLSNIHFVIVGGSPNFISRAYTNTIKKITATHRVTNFHLTGFVDDDMLHNLFHHADLYISVSQSEACNLALIEAASYKLPIITTDVGAARDLFSNQAFFLDRYCDAKEIKDSVLEMINQPRVTYDILPKITKENTMKNLLEFYEYITR